MHYLNSSDVEDNIEDRVVLIVDLWNSNVTKAERTAINHIYSSE